VPTLPPAVPNALIRYTAGGELETASASSALYDAIAQPTPPTDPAVGTWWADTSSVAQEPTGKSFRAAQVALGSGAGTQDVQWAADANWTDLHRPKLIVSLGGRITANAAVAHGFSQSLGFMAAAMERAAWWGSPDNVATTVPRSRLRSAGLSLYSPGSTPTADGEASLAALLPNGYRITRDVAPGGAYLANTLVLGGASVRVAMGEALMPTAIGAQVYATGFQPTAVLVMAVLDDGSTADAANATNAVRRCLGFASGTAALAVVASSIQCSVEASATVTPAVVTEIPIAADIVAGSSVASTARIPIPIAAHVEAGSSVESDITLPLPEGTEGEFLGYDATGVLDNIAITTLLERLVAASPPAGETYTLEEV
jgi:hypothetical protein